MTHLTLHLHGKNPPAINISARAIHHSQPPRVRLSSAALGATPPKNVALKMGFATFRSPPERLLSTHQEVNKPFVCQARSPTRPPERCDTPRTERVRFNQRSHTSAADITSDSQKLFFASLVLFQTRAPPESKRASGKGLGIPRKCSHALVLCMSSPSFIPASAGAPSGSVFHLFASRVATPNLLSNYKAGTAAWPPHTHTPPLPHRHFVQPGG